MRYLGYQYSEGKKNNYCNKHEELEKTKYREKNINKYFRYEKNTYRRVHLEESHAIKLEENDEVRLLSSTFIQFEKNEQKFREYHVDIHPIFMSRKYKKNHLQKRSQSQHAPDDHRAG